MYKHGWMVGGVFSDWGSDWVARPRAGGWRRGVPRLALGLPTAPQRHTHTSTLGSGTHRRSKALVFHALE